MILCVCVCAFGITIIHTMYGQNPATASYRTCSILSWSIFFEPVFSVCWKMNDEKSLAVYLRRCKSSIWFVMTDRLDICSIDWPSISPKDSFQLNWIKFWISFQCHQAKWLWSMCARARLKTICQMVFVSLRTYRYPMMKIKTWHDDDVREAIDTQLHWTSII